jgi:ATP-dependent Clp protease, protease subunit
MINKKVIDEDYIEVDDLDSLLTQMDINVKKDIKDFSDLINLDSSLKREIFIGGEITDGIGSSTDSIIRFWNTYDDNRNIPIDQRIPIKVYIDSVGGSLVDTLTIIDSIKLSKTPVWTIAVGAAYSGGCFIAMSGHRRIGYKHSSYLFHEGSTQTGGTSSQFENYSKFYKTQLEQLSEIVLTNTNLTTEWYKEHKKEDMWFTAQEALDAGIIDEIATDLF